MQSKVNRKIIISGNGPHNNYLVQLIGDSFILPIRHKAEVQFGRPIVLEGTT